MSRHHIMPPAVYMPPPPKPKETKRKRGVGYASAAKGTGETEEAGESEETTAAHAAGAAGVPQRQIPVEAAERRIPSPNGKLSDDILKALIEVQEKDGGEGAP